MIKEQNIVLSSTITVPPPVYRRINVILSSFALTTSTNSLIFPDSPNTIDFSVDPVLYTNLDSYYMKLIAIEGNILCNLLQIE